MASKRITPGKTTSRRVEGTISLINKIPAVREIEAWSVGRWVGARQGCWMRMAPKTGGSLSCNTVFSVRFLSPGVNVLRRGFRHGVNLCSGPEVSRANGVRTVCEGRAKPLRRGLPSGANEMRMPVRKRMRFPCAVLSRLSVHSVRMACPRLCVCRHAKRTCDVCRSGAIPGAGLALPRRRPFTGRVLWMSGPRRCHLR